MEHDIAITIDEIESLLSKTFKSLSSSPPSSGADDNPDSINDDEKKVEGDKVKVQIEDTETSEEKRKNTQDYNN